MKDIDRPIHASEIPPMLVLEAGGLLAEWSLLVAETVKRVPRFEGKIIPEADVLRTGEKFLDLVSLGRAKSEICMWEQAAMRRSGKGRIDPLRALTAWFEPLIQHERREKSITDRLRPFESREDCL